MPRLTQLDDILFPVEEHPVFVSAYADIKERRIPVPNKKAIVNTRNYRVLGVVSRDYRLVTNQEALNLAYECCSQAFPETKPAEWEVQASDAPQTGGYCYIDLAHNSTKLDFSLVQANKRPDAFGPFIRVTNSYNCLRALSFDIGFYRKVCKNGMILPETIIYFKFNHLQREMGKKITFEINEERLQAVKNSFYEYIESLQTCTMPRAYFEPLLCGVLHINKPDEIKLQDGKTSADWRTLNNHIYVLCDRYFMELGNNAYAAFNAITDFASHPLENRCVYRERHSFQRLAGDWLSKFSQECQQNNFNILSYLAKIGSDNGKQN